MLNRLTLAGLFFAATLVAPAATVYFQGPDFTKGLQAGQPCTVGQPYCVIGDPLSFEPFSASLTTPGSGNPNWTLTINTNYGTALPGSTEAIPAYFNPEINGTFAMGDFLITSNGVNYGIVLHAHDGYTAGSVYVSPNGYVQSQDVLSTQLGALIFNPYHPVEIASGATKIGSGTVSASKTGNGVTSGLYTIVVSFSAPSGFLSTGTFAVDFSTYACANGVIVGNSTFSGGSSGGVPEPATWVMCLPALLFGLRKLRNRN